VHRSEIFPPMSVQGHSRHFEREGMTASPQ
jgi:hypothetical protein